MRILISLLCLICTSLTLFACLAEDHHPATTVPISVADTATWKKLEQPIATPLHSDHIEFSAALDWLTRSTGMKLEPDWLAIEQTTPKNTIISINLHDVTAHQALTLLLEEASGGQSAPLAFDVDGGIVKISTQDAIDKPHMERREYEVADLIALLTPPGADPSHGKSALRWIVLRYEFPGLGCIYDPNSDPAPQFEGTRLVVKQPTRIQNIVSELLESMHKYKTRPITTECLVFLSPKPLAEMNLQLEKEHRAELCFTQEEIKIKLTNRRDQDFEVVSDAAAQDLERALRSNSSITPLTKLAASAFNGQYALVSATNSGATIQMNTMSIVRQSEILNTYFEVNISPLGNTDRRDATGIGSQIALPKDEAFFRERRLSPTSSMILILRSRLSPEPEK